MIIVRILFYLQFSSEMKNRFNTTDRSANEWSDKKKTKYMIVFRITTELWLTNLR